MSLVEQTLIPPLFLWAKFSINTSLNSSCSNTWSNSYTDHIFFLWAWLPLQHLRVSSGVLVGGRWGEREGGENLRESAEETYSVVEMCGMGEIGARGMLCHCRACKELWPPPLDARWTLISFFDVCFLLKCKLVFLVC